MRGKSPRGAAMSQKMRQIKATNPGIPQTQVLSMASKELSGKQSKEGGFLPLLLSGLAGAILPKLLGSFMGSGMPSNRGRGLNLGKGMYLKPYR
jgi:hypothetical protein